MDTSARKSKPVTPVKDTHKIQEAARLTENSNPNFSSPNSKSVVSPSVKSLKSQKSVSKIQNAAVYSPRNKIRERKFVVAKKKKSSKNEKVKDCKCKEKNGGKCLCVAYESLRASQEEFFKMRGNEEAVELGDVKEVEEELEMEKGFMAQKIQSYEGDGSERFSSGEIDELGENGIGVSTIKRRREKLLEEARCSAPECGKVMHLVSAFEKMLTIKKPDEFDGNGEFKTDEKKKRMQWALPGMQAPKEDEEAQFSLPKFQPLKVVESPSPCSSFNPSDLCLTSENLGLDPRMSVSSSWDGSQGSTSSRLSNGGRRSRRNSSDGSMSGRRLKKKHVKVTCLRPFKLMTEQRGKLKEEEFTKKLQEMKEEEERLRIPIAQGLPWTTDEPENLIKPQVKEITRPVDLKLHTDIRAVERSEFDNQVAEKLSLIEQYKMERERLQKLAEEEEVRRLRKELVPKAQPMPYFDRPFIPRRSMKQPTVPKDPKFHIPHHKKIKCLSWSEIDTFTFHQ